MNPTVKLIGRPRNFEYLDSLSMLSQNKNQRMEGRTKCSKRKLNVDKNDEMRKEGAPLSAVEIKTLSPYVFEDDSSTVGGVVKSRGQVLMQRERYSGRPPNTSCRIETFGRICQTFDDRKCGWVCEMGFGGLLKFVGDMHLPRQLSYWLFTLIDPFNCTLKSVDGKLFNLSKNQVHWVLGIPNRGLAVPSYISMTADGMGKIDQIMGKYGKSFLSKSTKTGRQYSCKGIPVSRKLMERLEGVWEEHEVDEFKLLFLLISLEMLLCPTQSSRLASDLVPALTCASRAAEYDWCSLVLNKLMDSVATFARRFYCHGYASGCGGCLIFVVVMYLDRLNRQPVHWGLHVWTMDQIGRASKADRMPDGGDFGQLGTLDVAYGENHPRLARDSEGPEEPTEDFRIVRVLKRKKNPTRRRISNNKNLKQFCPRESMNNVLLGRHCKSLRPAKKCIKNDECVLVNVVDVLGLKMEQIRRWLYVDVDLSAILVSELFSRMNCSLGGWLVKYAFILPVFLKFRCNQFLNISPVMALLSKFFRVGCCGLLLLVSQEIGDSSRTIFVEWVSVLKCTSSNNVFMLKSYPVSGTCIILKKRIRSLGDLVHESTQTVPSCRNVMMVTHICCDH